MKPVCLLLACLGPACAADLAGNLAADGPFGDRPAAFDSGPFAQTLLSWAPQERLRGLEVIRREDPGLPDIQANLGWCRSNHHGKYGLGDGDIRHWLSLGSDPSAAEAGQARVGAGLAYSSSLLLALRAEADWSEAHGPAITVSVEPFFLHVAVEADEDGALLRVGSVLRLPAIDADWAGGIGLDYAREERSDAGVTAEGALGEAWICHRWGGFLLAAQVQAAHAVREGERLAGGLITASAGLGWVF